MKNSYFKSENKFLFPFSIVLFLLSLTFTFAIEKAAGGLIHAFSICQLYFTCYSFSYLILLKKLRNTIFTLMMKKWELRILAIY